jgi:hypothetical protein
MQNLQDVWEELKPPFTDVSRDLYREKEIAHGEEVPLFRVCASLIL